MVETNGLGDLLSGHWHFEGHTKKPHRACDHGPQQGGVSPDLIFHLYEKCTSLCYHHNNVPLQGQYPIGIACRSGRAANHKPLRRVRRLVIRAILPRLFIDNYTAGTRQAGQADCRCCLRPPPVQQRWASPRFPCCSRLVPVAPIKHVFDGIERLLQLIHAVLVLGGNAGQGLHQALLALLATPERPHRLDMLVQHLAVPAERRVMQELCALQDREAVSNSRRVINPSNPHDIVVAFS